MVFTYEVDRPAVAVVTPPVCPEETCRPVHATTPSVAQHKGTYGRRVRCRGQGIPSATSPTGPASSGPGSGNWLAWYIKLTVLGDQGVDHRSVSACLGSPRVHLEVPYRVRVIPRKREFRGGLVCGADLPQRSVQGKLYSALNRRLSGVEPERIVSRVPHKCVRPKPT